MNRNEILAQINGRPWFHRIEVAPGIVTPGHDDTPRKAGLLQLPADLTGKRVLDIGAFDGYFSFEAERRGAAYVLAYDHNPPDAFGFNTAKAILGSRVEHRVGSVYDLSPDTVGEFDVVFFLGVIYHLRSPLLALQKIHAVCKEMMYLESHVAAGGFIEGNTIKTGHEIDKVLDSIAFAQFFPGAEFNDDASNWWIPSVRCLEQWIRAHGFQATLVAQWSSASLPGARAAFHCRRLPGPLPWFVTNY